MDIKIMYTLSEKGQKVLLSQDRNAKKEQEVIITDTEKKLLPHVSVLRDGTVNLNLDGYTQEWFIAKDAIFNNPQFPHFFLDDTREWVYRHSFRVAGGVYFGLDKPIDSINDVLSVINASTSLKETIANQIIDSDKDDAQTYETAKAKYKSQEAEKTRRQLIRDELAKEYADSLAKLNQISNLIENKTRIRTAQIKTIIG